MRFSRVPWLLAVGVVLQAHVAFASDGSPDEHRRSFAAAVAAYERGDDATAAASFARLRESYPDLGDYHLRFLGRIHLRTQDADAANKAYAALLTYMPKSVHAGEAALELGRLAAAAGDHLRAKRFFERAIYLDDERHGDAARLELAKLRFRTSDAADAHTAFVAVRRDAADVEISRIAKEYIATLRAQDPTLAPSGRGALEEAELLLEEGDPNAALFAAKQVAVGSPELRAEALRVEADAHFALDQDDRAFAALWAVVEEDPRDAEAAESLYRLAAKLWNRDRDAAALRAFTRYRERYPRGRRTFDARYATARIHESAGRFAEAREAYVALIRAAPGHRLAQESRWRLAWAEYRRGDPWEAAKAFADIVERTEGRERDAAMYWRARCHQRLGRLDRARVLFAAIAKKRSYYGMWAARRLGEIESGALPGFGVRRLAPATTVRQPVRAGRPPSGIDAFHWNRFVELEGAGLARLAYAELAAVERAARSDVEVRRFLFSAYRAIGRYDEALRLMARLGSAAGLSSAERRRTLYPLAYWETVRDAAHARQVDPLLVLALMRQESLFDPEARSPADAFGLLQLLPSTARRVAAEQGAAAGDPSRLTDPRHNVALGVAYLGQLLDLYRGDPFRALAAYNGGEDAVEKWRQRWPNADADEFVESISYRETRDYVKKVIGNYVEYRAIYE